MNGAVRGLLFIVLSLFSFQSRFQTSCLLVFISIYIIHCHLFLSQSGTHRCHLAVTGDTNFNQVARMADRSLLVVYLQKNCTTFLDIARLEHFLVISMSIDRENCRLVLELHQEGYYRITTSRPFASAIAVSSATKRGPKRVDYPKMDGHRLFASEQKRNFFRYPRKSI